MHDNENVRVAYNNDCSSLQQKRCNPSDCGVKFVDLLFGSAKLSESDGVFRSRKQREVCKLVSSYVEVVIERQE